MACFTCNENKSMNTVAILQMYKEAYEKTGLVYWFFREVSNNEVKIMDDAGFRKFKKENAELFSNKEIEFARIDEFRIIENNIILENSRI